MAQSAAKPPTGRGILRRLTVVVLLAVLNLAPLQTLRGETSFASAPDCFRRLDSDRQDLDSLTLTLIDSTQVPGRRPIISLATSMIYMERIADSGLSTRITIPFERIAGIRYSKPGHLRWSAPLAGFLVGSIAGGYAGASIDSESRGIFDSSEIVNAMIGAVVGGLIGMLIGHQIGKHHTTTVVLDCQ